MLPCICFNIYILEFFFSLCGNCFLSNVDKKKYKTNLYATWTASSQRSLPCPSRTPNLWLLQWSIPPSQTPRICHKTWTWTPGHQGPSRGSPGVSGVPGGCWYPGLCRSAMVACCWDAAGTVGSRRGSWKGKRWNHGRGLAEGDTEVQLTFRFLFV